MFKSFDISLLSPGAPVDAETVSSVGTGDVENAGLCLAKALAGEGARVVFFCNTTVGWTDSSGVRCRPAAGWPAFVKGNPHDVCIVQGLPEVFARRTNARLNIFWPQDMARGRDAATLGASAWNIDGTMVRSRYMLQQYRDVYALDEGCFVVCPDGVDLNLMQALANQRVPRDRKKLVWAAQPERGLDVLLGQIMPRLLERDASLRLHVLAHHDRASELAGFDDECKSAAARFGDRVISHGPLPKRELYQHYLSAGVHVYPTPSPAASRLRDVSGVIALECQAAGLPIVTTSMGALPEIVAPGAGVLVDLDDDKDASHPRYLEAFVEAVLGLVNDDAAWSAASARGIERARQHDWSETARSWLSELERMIRRRNDSEERLIRHFLRRSAPESARTVVARGIRGSEGSASRSAELADLLPASPEGGEAALDETARVETPARAADRGLGLAPAAIEATFQEPRFTLLERWLAERMSQMSSVLLDGFPADRYAVALAVRQPSLRLGAVCADGAAARAAIEAAARYGMAQRIAFRAADRADPPPDAPRPRAASGTYDCAVLLEELAASAAPWLTLQRLEEQVRRGGRLYVTVPIDAGRGTPARRSPRWSLDIHDLREMVGAKPEFVMSSIYAGDDPVTGDPRGWWVVSYVADHQPVPAWDLDRHIWLQRPIQSVSAAIIAGPDAEQTLHWMLQSIADIVDEIVVADCGMNDEARRIAEQYGARLLEGVDPRREGFERARNLALDACRGDWCLWLDTDEKLVNPALLSKYLRENVYHSYGITQHNFSIDEPQITEKPVRLFRRRPHQGRSVRFWGAIHEHPELAVNEGAGVAAVIGDVHIAHVGYLADETRRGRIERNQALLALDRERYPERIVQKYYLMGHNMVIVHQTLKANAPLPPEIAARCRETIDLYRQFGSKMDNSLRRHALAIYSDALAVLGEGFEVTLMVEAGKTQSPSGEVKRYRFASSADLHAELKLIADEKVGRLDSPWW